MTESDSSDGDWEGLDSEGEELNEETQCVFCDDKLSSPEVLIEHCARDHTFDFVSLSKMVSLDAISYIKLVNYLRVNKPLPEDLLQNLKGSTPWDRDDYMKPFSLSDPLLTFDIESFLEEKLKNSPKMEETVTILKSEYEALLQKLSNTDTQLQNAWDRIERMKETTKSILYSGDNFAETNNSSQCCDADSYYFSSYDHFGIHHEMLQDKIRTLAYREAILGNRDVFTNRKVLDLGCGTAILSMFAASAGASKVYAIDKSDVIYQAMDIVRENEFDNEIDLFKGRVEDVSLPAGKVDIIVSEWMGYFLLFEGMLDSVLHARDKYLAKGGLLLPDRCTLSMVALSDKEKYQDYVTFWDDVYGYKMSVLKKEVVKEANVEDVKADMLCSNPVVIKEFDLFTCTVEDTEFSTRFELLMTKTCKVTSLVGFFDCMFEKGLTNKVTLSTSPLSESTHWKQTTFLLPDPVEVKSGEVIPCRLSCRKNRRDPRTLIVKIDFGKSYNQYYLS